MFSTHVLGLLLVAIYIHIHMKNLHEKLDRVWLILLWVCAWENQAFLQLNWIRSGILLSVDVFSQGRKRMFKIEASKSVISVFPLLTHFEASPLSLPLIFFLSHFLCMLMHFNILLSLIFLFCLVIRMCQQHQSLWKTGVTHKGRGIGVRRKFSSIITLRLPLSKYSPRRKDSFQTSTTRFD